MIRKIADGRTDLIFDFVKSGNSPRSADEFGTPLIKWCAYHGDVSAIKYLLSKGEKLESLGSNFDLNGACFHGHWQLCQFLIEKGADVNEPLSETGETPLHSALCKANRPVYDHIVEMLLLAGANPNCKTKISVETGSFVRDSKTRAESPLHRAAAFGSEKAIQFLLDSGADIKSQDSNGDTPLSWASWHLRPPSILRLLCYGSFSIHSDNQATYDHGVGWGQIDHSFRAKPHFK